MGHLDKRRPVFNECTDLCQRDLKIIFTSIGVECKRQYGTYSNYIKSCEVDGLAINRSTFMYGINTGNVCRIPFIIISFHLNKLNISLVDALTKYSEG